MRIGVAALLVLALGLEGCFLFRTPRPWTVNDVTEVDGYLSATFTRDDETLGFFFAPSGDCRAILRNSAEIFYEQRGPLGTVAQDDRDCVPIGIGQLRAWARRNPTPRDLPILPSLPAHFREIHRDAHFVLVRGSFPLAGLVYFHSGRDAVAFLPNSPACEPAIAQGGANMQYKRWNENVVWLGSVTAPCPILGLAFPLTAEQPSSQPPSPQPPSPGAD